MKNKTWKRWTPEEHKLLEYHWQYSDMQTLLNALPGRTYEMIMVRAGNFGIKSQIRRSRQNGNIKILLDESKLSFYLLGFILADGCFTTKNDLSISQKIEEKQFFIKLISKLGGNINKIKQRQYKNGFTGKQSECVYFRIGDKKTIDEIKNRVGLGFCKTYNPPKNIEYFFKKDYLLNMVIGLTDGDGCVWLTNNNNWPNIRIEMHYNWLPILQKIQSKLKEFYDLESTVKVSKRGFAQLYFVKKNSIKKLLDASKETIRMESKWNKLETIKFN